MTKRANIFKKAKLPFCNLLNNARVSAIRPLKIGDWGIIYMPLRVCIAQGMLVLVLPVRDCLTKFIVIALYSKGGGKHGRHAAVPSVKAITSTSYLASQVFNIILVLNSPRFRVQLEFSSAGSIHWSHLQPFSVFSPRCLSSSWGEMSLSCRSPIGKYLPLCHMRLTSFLLLLHSSANGMPLLGQGRVKATLEVRKRIFNTIFLLLQYSSYKKSEFTTFCNPDTSVRTKMTPPGGTWRQNRAKSPDFLKSLPDKFGSWSIQVS